MVSGISLAVVVSLCVCVQLLSQLTPPLPCPPTSPSLVAADTARRAWAAGTPARTRGERGRFAKTPADATAAVPKPPFVPEPWCNKHELPAPAPYYTRPDSDASVLSSFTKMLQGGAQVWQPTGVCKHVFEGGSNAAIFGRVLDQINALTDPRAAAAAYERLLQEQGRGGP